MQTPLTMERVQDAAPADEITPAESEKTTRLSGVKRYNLALPEALFHELQTLAEERQTTVVELLRKFIKLGLIASTIEDKPGSGLFIRENGTENRIILI